MDLMKNDCDAIELRLLNALMLFKCYEKVGDDQRIIRFMSQSTTANLYLPSLLLRLTEAATLGNNNIQSLVLYIL